MAIVFAAWVARRSLQDWRQERLEDRQFEIAEEALVLASRAGEVFDYIRASGGFRGSEGQNGDVADLLKERADSEAEFFERVRAIRPLVAAVFGQGQVQPFEEILRLRWRIIGPDGPQCLVYRGRKDQDDDFGEALRK